MMNADALPANQAPNVTLDSTHVTSTGKAETGASERKAFHENGVRLWQISVTFCGQSRLYHGRSLDELVSLLKKMEVI